MPDNDHGWERIGSVGEGVAFVAPLVEERRRCACQRDCPCMREATQEDLLCDECREVCR